MWNKLWSANCDRQRSPCDHNKTKAARSTWTEVLQAANELLIDIWWIEWILIGWGGRQSSVGRRWLMNLGQTAVLSHISGGHWRFEPARRNCHFISAGNGASKRNGLLFLVPLSVFKCAYVSWFYACWGVDGKNNSRLLSGAKILSYYSATQLPSEAQECRNNKH